MSMHADTPPTSRSEVPEGMHGDIHALSDHCLIRQLGQHASNVASNVSLAENAQHTFPHGVGRDHRGGLHGCASRYSMVALLGN